MIHPSDNHVLVKPEPIQEFGMKNGIITPNTVSKYRKGEVIAKGDMVECLSVGDIVTFNTLHAPEIEEWYLVNTDEKDCGILFKHN